MDFVNRAQQPRPVATGANGHPPAGASPASKQSNRDVRADNNTWFRIGAVVLAALVAVIILALIVNLSLNNNPNQAKYVNKNEYQAVFVNVNGTSGGQVYFGHIRAVNNQFVDLTNVFYIQNQNQSTSTASSSYTLVKLGCELHGPEDQMVINTSQVYFWENIKSSGQVAQKIAQYYQANPNGQNCAQSSASNSTDQSSTSTQPTTSTGAAGTSATSNATNSTSSTGTKKQ